MIDPLHCLLFPWTGKFLVALRRAGGNASFSELLFLCLPIGGKTCANFWFEFRFLQIPADLLYRLGRQSGQVYVVLTNVFRAILAQDAQKQRQRLVRQPLDRTILIKLLQVDSRSEERAERCRTQNTVTFPARSEA